MSSNEEGARGPLFSVILWRADFYRLLPRPIPRRPSSWLGLRFAGFWPGRGKPSDNLVSPQGFEPWAYGFANRRSSTELRGYRLIRRAGFSPTYGLFQGISMGSRLRLLTDNGINYLKSVLAHDR